MYPRGFWCRSPAEAKRPPGKIGDVATLEALRQADGTLVQGFLYENQLEPVAELDGSGNLVSRFVYCECGAGNIPQYMVKGGVTYRILAG